VPPLEDADPYPQEVPPELVSAGPQPTIAKSPAASPAATRVAWIPQVVGADIARTSKLEERSAAPHYG
jgi:hypothetical protein